MSIAGARAFLLRKRQPKAPPRVRTPNPDRKVQGRAMAKATGRCHSCLSRPLVPGLTRCQECRDQKAAWDQRRRAEGKCRDCAGPLTTGRARCEPCGEKHNRLASEAQKRLMARRRSEGLCIRCEAPSPETARCATCLNARRADDREGKRRQQAVRRQYGLCVWCGEPSGDKARCEKHRARRLELERERSAAKAAKENA